MAGKRFAVPIVILFVALFLGLFPGSQQTARADKYQPGGPVSLVNPAPAVSSNVTQVYDLASTDLQYNLTFPTTLSPDFTLTSGRSMPVGAIVGGLESTAVLGFSNAVCNIVQPTSFTFYNATTNIWDTFVLLADRSNAITDTCHAGNHLSNLVDCYPTLLNRMFDPDDTYATMGDPFAGIPPLVPRARYSGITNLGGTWVTLQFVEFDPGQLLQMGTPSAWLNPLSQYGEAWGYPSETVLEDPTVAEATQTITDFCTPLSSIPNMLGVTLDNPDTTTIDETGYVRGINPPVSTGLLLSGTQYYASSSATYRDIDGDNIENQLDTCPLVANIDGDPRVTAGPDGDMIDSACDPSAMRDINCNLGVGFPDDADDDNDTVPDVTDNCTCVSNVGQADADGDGTGDACDPSTATAGQPGYHNAADMDNDGFMNAQDNCTLVQWSSIDELERWGAFPADGGPRTDSIGSACDPNWNNDTVLSGYECTAAWNAGHPGVNCGTCVNSPAPLAAYKQTCTVANGANQNDWVLHANKGDNFYLAATTIAPLCVGGVDVDGDGLCSGIDPNDNWASDNCPLVANANQLDTDGDGIGDACDSDPNPNVDKDGDTVLNTYQQDNCPLVANPPTDCDADALTANEQCDDDHDGIGNACDPSVHTIIGGHVTDSDGDTVMDVLDNCTYVANANQADADGDGTGDACDPGAGTANVYDVDGDAIPNHNTEQPSIEAYWMKLTTSLYEANAAPGSFFDVCHDGLDNDADGSIDAADPGCVCPVADDSDCDGVCNPGADNALCIHEVMQNVTPPPSPPNPISSTWHELSPVLSEMWHLTSWYDTGPLNPGELGPSDTIDMTEMDTGDVHWFHVLGITGPPEPPNQISLILRDNCPTVANPTQTDRDNDGQGDACDSDSDGDTISDVNETNNPIGSYNTDWCDALDSTRPATNDPDTDGDTNATEAINGTNPCNPDTDGDSGGVLCGALPCFTEPKERIIGTDPLDGCPDATNDNAWPPDFNNSGRVTSADLVLFKQHYNSVPNFLARYDLNASDGTTITSADLVVFKKYYTGTGKDVCKQ